MRKYYLVFWFLAVAFTSFSQNYTILGNSSSMGGCNCFRLTPDAENQAGAIFQNQTINLNNSFDFTFNVLLGCNNGNDAADGIVFVLTSNPNGLGNPGEGLGYAGGNQPFSIGVEFDTWENGNAGDPSYDHIGIESGGLYNHNVASPVPALPGSGNIDNCQWYLVRIVWDVNTNTFSVYFNGVLRQQVVIPNMVATYFGGNPVVNWGWSGATGGGTNDQQVCVLNTSNWVAGVNYQSCDLTMQFSDISTSSLGSVQSWAWNFGDNTTSNLQNPTHTYAALGTYTVTLTITDISGCTNTYTHPVTINTPITLTPTLTPPPCNGGLNGSVAVTPAGGFGPAAGYGGYSYSWNGGINTFQTYAGAPAGTYAVTVTDGVCTATGQYTLSEPPPLTATTSHTDANCGLNNGTATITLLGGTPPYTTVNWGSGGICNPTPTCTVSGLMWGVYVADFRDANSCSSLLQYRETVAALPCGYSLTSSGTNVSCWGGSNGTATVNPSGGSFPWTTIWSPGGGTGNTITGLTAGTYTYTTNNGGGGQTFTGTVTVSQPGAPMTASVTALDMSCANSNDGQALANVTSGGVAPYTYAWSRGTPNGASSGGLSPGTISVVITDANGCTASASGNITGPPTLTLNVTSVDDSCYQSQTGSATANVTGGNPPYLYYWSNISSAQTNLSLGVGTYTVTVTDDKGCTITGSATINQPTPFTHTLTSSNVLCNGSSTGTINITTSGGTPTPTYTWNPSTATGANPTGLAAGQYNVTIADGNNCRILDSVVITQPATALTVTTSHTDVTCYGASDGTLTVTIAGGTPPYSYQGFPVPPGTTTIPGLPDSTYAGNVLDANGCSVTVSETISGPGPQSLAIVSVTDNICNGGNAGAITVNFVNATGTPSYNWNPGGVLPDTRTGLNAGVYNITATDQNSCTVSGSAIVNEPAAPVMTVTTVDATCFGGNGTATASPVGGGTFNYSWTVPGAGNTQTVAPLAGTYDVTASDANLCRQTATFTINQPADIIVAETHTNLRCFGDADGTISLTPTGGTGTYTYTWTPNVSTIDNANTLTAGTYDIIVSDQTGCSKSVSIILTQPAQPLAVNIQSNNVRCFGQNNGSITIIASGGTPGYTYTWNPNVSTTNSATGLSPNNYSIIVADSNNCSLNPIVSISEPSQPLTLTPTSTNLTCYQSANGTASVTVAGGTLPYTYAWTPAVSTGPSASALAAGNYSVLVTDFNGCTNTQPFVLTEPAQLVATETHQNVRCFGEANGSIDINVTGGTPGFGYVYTWTPNVSTSDTVSGLVAGAYTVVVTDSNNCSTTQPVIVTEPQVLDVTAVSTDVLCNGGSTGIITATVTGGTVAYSYSATDGVNNFTSTNGIFNGLPQGSYTVYVVDQNTCADSTAITVNEPVVLSSLTDVYPTLCYNSADGRVVVTALGGVSAYTFNLSNGTTNNTGIFDGLVAGFYSVTITDASGCVDTDSGTVTEPDSVFVTVSPTPVEVKLGDQLQITTTTNQSGVLTYQWNPDFGLSCSGCANPLFNGVYSQPYSVTVTTADGCQGTSGFTVTVIPNYDLFIPNAFSPNGDSENEYWQLFGNLDALKQVNVMVFNRIGEKVYESNDIYFKWDGTYKGERVPPGVYVYVTKFVWLNNHSDYDYTGSITVLR